MSTLFVWAVALFGLVASALPADSGLDLGSGESHCVLTVIGEESDGQLVMSEPDCYSTFARAMSVASNGSVELATDATGAVMFDDEAVAAAASSFTMGIHFDGYNGTGSSKTVVGSSCTGGWWNAWDFYNRINSSYNGCTRLKHYDGWNASGYLTYTYGAGTTDNLPSSAVNKTNSVSYHSS